MYYRKKETTVKLSTGGATIQKLTFGCGLVGAKRVFGGIVSAVRNSFSSDKFFRLLPSSKP